MVVVVIVAVIVAVLVVVVVVKVELSRVSSRPTISIYKATTYTKLT